MKPGGLGPGHRHSMQSKRGTRGSGELCLKHLGRWPNREWLSVYLQWLDLGNIQFTFPAVCNFRKDGGSPHSHLTKPLATSILLIKIATSRE
eukprot:2498639-Rhodomonas_salina.3